MAEPSSSASGPAAAAAPPKRHCEELGGGGASSSNSSKRRRLGDASVLCMRELFRAVVSNGDVTVEEQIGLQNVAVLLSQMRANEKTWVNFSDTDGELQDLAPQQLRTLKPFLERVAHELTRSETEVISRGNEDSEEYIDCLALARVPWADGITCRQLLTCCTPEPALELPSRWAWLDGVTLQLPTKYMLRSRVRELIRHYHLRYQGPAGATSPRSNAAKKPFGYLFAGVGRCAAGVGRCAAAGARFVTWHVAAGVYCGAAAALAVVSWIGSLLPLGREPIWPALRLVCVTVLASQVKKLLGFVVLIARLRVILCLSSCNMFFARVFFPFVFLATKVLGWNQGSWLLGCSCDSAHGVSVLSYIPMQTSSFLVWAIALLRPVPLLGGMANVAEQLHPGISFLFDLLFSIGIAEGLATMVDHAEEHAQPKLVWMSMNVARIIREAPLGPATSSPDTTEPPCGGEPEGREENAAADAPLPAWDEGGEWSLFG